MTIPAELISVPQWVLWKSEHRGGAKPTKVPYNANTGLPADVTDPGSYAEHAQVVNGHAIGYSGQGFVVTDNDVYTGFDLDDPYADTINGQLIERPQGDPAAESIRRSHMAIVQYMNSYTEWSPSGRGLRIIIRGKLPPEWRNRVGKIEIYSRARFLTLTGNHLAGTPLTIEDRQAELEEVARQLGLDKPNTGATYESRPETRDDAAVVAAIRASAVGAQFSFLFDGGSTGDGQSEADLALANYICYFTDNKEQAERIFRSSNHYAGRTKLHSRDDLVTRAIQKGFDQKPPPIDTTALRQAATALDASAPEVAPKPEDLTHRPEGTLGLIADFIYNSAPYPIPEFAVAGAIGLLAGIVGRAYNIDGQGLNQYVAMIGRTGIGKDAVPSGISKLLRYIEPTIPAVRSFVGPRSIMSAQALRKTFDPSNKGSPSYLSIRTEFGEWLLTHSDIKADATKRDLIAEIMAIYSESGYGHEGGSLAYSDTDKNVKATRSPAFSMLGDTVPGSFYEACNARNISKGLIPRLLIMEYKGLKPSLNESAAFYRPEQMLIECLSGIITSSLQANERNQPLIVSKTEAADRLLREFQAECDRIYNETTDDAKGSIYSRAGLKAKKLAGLIAVGYNWLVPCVTENHAAYAINLARRDIRNLLDRMASGEVEVIQAQQEGDDLRQITIAHIFQQFFARDYSALNDRDKQDNTADMYSHKVMRLGRLRNACLTTAPFRKMMPGIKDKEFDAALKQMNDVLQVANADAYMQMKPDVMREWKMKPNTQLVHCVDVERLMSIASQWAR